MNQKWRIILLSALWFAAAPLGFSQSSSSVTGNPSTGTGTMPAGKDPGNVTGDPISKTVTMPAGNDPSGKTTSPTTPNGPTSGSKSTAGASANAVVNMEGSGGGSSQFIEALPGPSSTVIPGYGSENPSCYVYFPPINPIISMDSARSMGKNVKLEKHTWITDDSKIRAIPVNDDDIKIVDYNARVTPNPGDQVLGSTIVPNKYLFPDDGLIMRVALEAKEKTHAKRMTIVGCPEIQNVTKMKVIGVGFSSGALTGNSTAQAASLGFSSGSNRIGKEIRTVFYVTVLNWNDGLTKPPTPAKPPESAKAEASTAPPPPSQPPPAPPPPQNFRGEVVMRAPAEVQEPLAPPPAPINECPLGPLTIYFPFDEPKPNAEDSYQVDHQYRDGIKKAAQWLINHPTCEVQIQGHTSKEASEDYNAKLGRRRAKAVYDQLLADGAKKEKLQYASLGKDFPRGEHEPENRRVILRVLTSASGK